jgi:hypothetical protein
MDRVYGSRDHGWLSVHGGLMTMERCGRSRAREVVVIAQREREGGGRQGSHQWRHLEAELQRRPHDCAQQRRLVVLQWGDSSRREEGRLEPGWVQWIMGVLSSRLL